MPDNAQASAAPTADNLQFLAGLDPALAARLQDMAAPYTKPVIADGAVVDIDLGEGRLYGRPAADFADEQVAAFLARPTRLLVNAPDAAKLMDPCSADLVRRFEAAAEELAAPLLGSPPAGRSGILFVVGIGLGRHIAPLIAATRPRHVVLVEPIGEFLLHALAATDWRALHAECTAIGATLDIVSEAALAEGRARLETVMAAFGETVLDGSYVYVHYVTPATREIADHIHQFAGMRAILKGYFDDDRLMVENMTAIVAACDFRLLDGHVRPPVDVPAIIVGSGPSLDASVEAIRRCRDHAVVITAGSTLQVVLHHGIVPDWHVEKENSPLTATRLRAILERNRERFPDGRFTGIRLIASTTVDPGVVALFDDVCLFLRTSLSSTAMFGDGHAAVDGTSPYSANAALTVAALLGFRNVFLFGCDCGARTGAGHHSRNTIYYGKEAAGEAGTYVRAVSQSIGRFDFPLTAPANFGGEVETNSYFLWSRRTYEQVIEALGLTAYNCSDGIAIAGAAALKPDDLSPDDGPSLDRIERDAADIHAFQRDIAAFLDAAAARWGGPVVLAGGTLRAQPALAGWWLNRTPDEAAGEYLFETFRRAYRAIAEQVLADGDTLMGKVAERAAPPALLQAVMQQKA